MSRYLPPLSLLISTEQLPSGLGFINTVFSKLYFKDLIVDKSFHNEEAHYDLTIVTDTKLGLDILGDNGLELLLNPDFIDGSTSEFPVSLSYYWPIIRYVRGFDISKFSFSISAIYDLLLKVTSMDDIRLLKSLVNNIYPPYGDEDIEQDPYQIFIDNFNNKHNPVTPIVYNEIHNDLLVEDILFQMSSNGNDYNIFDVVLNDYLTQNDDFGTIESKLKGLFFTALGSFELDDIARDLLIPQVLASLNDLSLAIAFPRTWLKPLDDNGEVIEDENIKSMLRFNIGTVRFSTENGLEFENESSFDFKKSQIGNTGMTLFFRNAKLDLSRTRNIPEAAAAGYPDDFVGVFVESAEIGLPDKWFKNIVSNQGATLGIFGENLLIGTGGISGTFGLRAIDTNTPIGANDYLWRRLGSDDSDFIIGFRSFDMTLRQGEFISTNIAGSLTIPGFKNANDENAKVNISMSFAKDGNFFITASESSGIPIRIPGVLDFTIKTLSVGRGRKGGRDMFFISTSGALQFTGSGYISRLFRDPLEIDQLIIWQDGTMELKGLDGVFKLPKPRTMSLGPADITVTAVHFGTDERMHGTQMRKYWYFGFDGGISVNPGGIDARGDGVKIYFTVDNSSSRPSHVFFRIQSIAIDLIIPGAASRENAAVLINGYLAVKEPSPNNTDASAGTEYVGGISLGLPRLRLSASAGMRYNPSVPSYLVDVGLDLPSAIPLGPTGMGIYGFRGLLGQRYITKRETVPGLTSNSSWWEYYKARVAPEFREGIQVSKMSNEDGFTVGAGASLATAFDGGRTFSSKVFVMLSLPEVLLIQGKGAILRERVSLDTTNDPPFSAMIAISNQSIEAAFGANMQIPEGGGQIANVSGAAEMAFFFNNSGSWYLNIGRNQPESRRVQARIFTLFNAHFYFMLNRRGIAAGAGARWEFNKRLGPLSLSAFAYLDVAGRVSFRPVQLGGSIALGAGATIGVWRIRLGLQVHAMLAAEAPRPFIITGAFSFKLNLPWPIRKLGGPYRLAFTWSFNPDRDLSEIPLIDPHNNVKAINRLTGESFPVHYNASGNLPSDDTINSHIIPVDSFIDVEFLKGMKLLGTTGTKFGTSEQGAHYTELIPPERGKSRQVTHEFQLEDIEIMYRDGNNWATYEMFEAIKPDDSESSTTEIVPPANIDAFKYGFWQLDTPHKYNKLRILSQSPLSYITHFTSGTPSPPENFGYKEGFLFCTGQKRSKTCVTFPDVEERFKAGIFRERQRVLIRVTGKNDGWVYPSNNPFNLNNALRFGDKIELFFAESQVSVDLRLTSYADEVRVKYFRQAQKEEKGFSNLPLFEYVEITEKIFTPPLSGNFYHIAYKHTEHNNYGVDMITIESIGGVANKSFLLTEFRGYLLQENRGRLLLENFFSGKTHLFSICMMNLKDFSFNLSVKEQDEITEMNQVMRESFQTVIEPIWRPNTIFRIKVTTNDVLSSESNTFFRNNYFFFFKTAGPVGHFHQHNSDYQDLLDKDREDQFRLATLKPYIDYSRSYPNADGRLINAKPLFYGDPKLLMFYKQNTIHAMFNNFASYGNTGAITSELRVLIKDPTESVSSNPDNPTQSKAGKSTWQRNPEPILTPEVRMINNLRMNGINCSGFEKFTPLAVAQEIEIGGLRPDTLYTAVFNAVYAPAGTPEDTAVVHSYVFKTSQYANFEQQVQSCILRDENDEKVGKAVFNIEKTFKAEAINKASALLNGTLVDDELISRYANEFDRLTDGILQLGVIPPPVTTDFNIIKNGNTIIGIIVRNPEPFNYPKIPESELSDTIQLSVGNNSANSFKVIFSPDNTQAFISNTVLNIPRGKATFTFLYKQYCIEGEKVGYVMKETVEIDNVNI